MVKAESALLTSDYPKRKSHASRKEETPSTKQQNNKFKMKN